jgi:hypothetical protein
LENVDIFYGHLECFMDIWDIVGPFGTLRVHLVHVSCFGVMHQEKSGNPGQFGMNEAKKDCWREI